MSTTANVFMREALVVRTHFVCFFYGEIKQQQRQKKKNTLELSSNTPLSKDI